jgi:gas vesicle protein
MGVIGKTLRFTLGLTVGVGIGAVAAMLLAPQSGKITTDEIKQRVNTMLTAGKEAQNKREKELQDYWEQEINKPEKDKAKDKK